MRKVLALQRIAVEGYAGVGGDSNTSCASCGSNQCCSYASCSCQSTVPPKAEAFR